MSRAFLVFSELRWEAVIGFVDIGGIANHHCLYFVFSSCLLVVILLTFSRPGRDRIVVGFTTIGAISAYHHYCEFKPVHGEMYSIQHYEKEFIGDLRQVSGLHLYSGFLHH